MLSEFLEDLCIIGPLVGNLTHSFCDGQGRITGFAQVVPEYQNQVMIHRLWTLAPGHGNGSAILNHLCELADRHRIILKLKALPIGAKPYPLSREQLVEWYGRHGFEGKRRKMIRIPRPRPSSHEAFNVIQIMPGNAATPRYHDRLMYPRL